MPSEGGLSAIWLVIGFLLCRSGGNILAGGVSIFPTNKLSIMQGAGFLAYLVPTQTGELVQWSHCSVMVAGNSYSLDNDQVHVVGGVTRVQRFNASVCGIRVENVQKIVEQDWTLSVLGADSKTIVQNLSLSVYLPKIIDILNVTISDTASSYSLFCPEDSSRRYCRILDQTDNVYPGCTKTFDVTWETAQFRCRMLYWGDMDEIETVINVSVEKSKRDVSISMLENESHVVLSCRYKSKVNPCRAVSVGSNRQMLLLDGHLTERYSAYDTHMESGICSIEILKPLHPEDYGIWRVFLELPNDYSGCVFNLDYKFSTMPDQSNDVVANTQLIKVFREPSQSTTTELSCEVSYPIDYCYLSGPNGGNYVPSRFDNLKTLGICLFNVVNITTGKWACGINDRIGDEDRMIYFDVEVYDQPGETITPLITGSAGDEDVKLLCRTILDMPIEICRFVSPSGEVHGLSENIVPNDVSRFRYYGKGLRTGECGMEIMALKQEDFGQWKCLIKVKNKDYAINFDVVEEGEL
ncbi:uncharacterized protein LOC131432384 isoform X2 [Malaya genurostris]|uniref:uncharacterized protein LOC131432384 isoform X2 n=1 Tax=Malaya genurostris TaxID=325434 RepID=UPI0026F3F094|nr:uncharacterized protein LOC131432384 isoform X2 [Malaya genurostris]